MKLPYFFTREGRSIVANAKEYLAAEQMKKSNKSNELRIQGLQKVIRADVYEKISAAIVAIVGSVILLTLPNENQQGVKIDQKQSTTAEPHEVSDAIEGADPTLVMKSTINIGVTSTPDEKQRMRDVIRKTLTIVLSDPQLSKVYATSAHVEQSVTSDLVSTLREISKLPFKEVAHLNPEKESAHGDAYTLATEDRDPMNDDLLEHKQFMFLRQELLDEGNEHRLLMTLDHELRHIKERGKDLPRASEEVLVYTTGIERMRKVAHALMKRGGEDGVIGVKMLSEAVPIHEQRLNSWKNLQNSR